MLQSFEVDEVVDSSLLAASGGGRPAIDLFRQLSVAKIIGQHVRIKQRERGPGTS